MALLLFILFVVTLGVTWWRHGTKPARSPRGRRARRALLASLLACAALPVLGAAPASAATLGSVVPATGPATGGTAVVITGADFVPGRTRVTFGGQAARNVTCSTTQCNVTSPAGVGTVLVVVTVNGQTPSNPLSFSYAPVISRLSPATGPSTGGTTVRVDGTGFVAGGTTFAMGAFAATVTTCATTRCTITTPAVPASTGTVNVVATVGGLASATNNATAFTFTAPAGTPAVPAVSAVSPANGRATGGTVVTITGTNFSVTTGATSVRFGATAATNVSCSSVTTCTATSPAGTGVVDVIVTVNGTASVATAADRFTYNAAPTVTGLAPASGSTTGGITTTITGTGFATAPGATAVRFGTTASSSVTCATTTSCTALVPPVATAGPVDVRVTVDTQTSAIAPGDVFTFTPPANPPLVDTVTPAFGPTTGGTLITVAGHNLAGGIVSIDGIDAIGSACAADGLSCTATTRPHAAGVGTVRVRVGALASIPTAGSVFTFAPALTEPPSTGRVITSFPQRDFVSIEGYPAANGPYRVALVRGGLEAFAVPNLMPDTAGIIEINHPGGACWIGSTPDITAPDAIRITDRFGIAEQTTTAFITTSPAIVVTRATDANVVQARGTAKTAAGTQLPIGEIEHRFVSSSADPFGNGRRTLRASSPAQDGSLVYDGPGLTTYTATYIVTDADLALIEGGAESRGVWLGVGAGGTGSTIFEVGPLVAAGPQAPCTAPLEPDTQAPTAPTNVVATVVDSDNVHLTWGAATDNRAVAGYRVYRDGGAIVTVSGSTLTYDDLHVAVAGPHTYAVTAIDATPNESVQAIATPNPVVTSAAGTPDLTIGVTRAPLGTLTVGDLVTYTVTITNIGSAGTAGRIDVAFPPVAGVTGVTAADAGGTGSPFVTFDCPLLTSCSTLDTVVLGPGADKKITFTGTLTTAAVPVLTSTFTVSGGGDVVTANNTTTDTATVLAAAGVVNEPPIDGHAIIAFPGRDFVSGEGFTPGELLTVEVWRSVDGSPLTRVAQARGVQADVEGLVEVNHPGGGCWNGDPLNPFGTATPGTPNLQPGDKVRYVKSDGTAYQITIAGVKANRPENPAPGVIVIRGSAQDANGLPLPLDQIEQRMIAGSNVGFFEINGGKRRIQAPGEGTLVYDSPTSINWTATYTGLSQADVDLAMIAESRVLWLGRDPLAGTELTIFEINDDVVKGPSAPCVSPADTATPLQGAPDLAIASTHGGDLTVGTNATYNLTLTNAGATSATGQVQVMHTLPTGLNFVSEASAEFDCTASGRTVTCLSDTDITAGSSVTLPITVSVSAAAIGTVKPFAEVSVALDASSLNNFVHDPTVVKAAAGVGFDLGVTSTHTGDFTATTNDTYTITVTNTGVASTSGTITVIDTLPAGLTYTGGGNANWNCGAAGQTVTCTTNLVLLTGASSSFPVNVLVGAAAVPSVTNTVTVAPTDGNPADNTDTDLTVVFPEVRPPAGGLHMIVFPSRDFVSIDGLTADQGPTVTVEARRNGVVIGTAANQPVTDDPGTAAFEGLVEINHVGDTDCWTVAPDLRPGDEIRLIDSKGRKFAIFVAGVRADRPIQIGTSNVVEVHGTAYDSAGLPLPIGQLEQRLIKDKNDPLFATNGRRDLRTGSDGTITYDFAGSTAWTARYTVNAADVPAALRAESRIVWSPNLLAGNDLTIFENGTGVVGGAAAGTCVGGNATPNADLGVTIATPAAAPGTAAHDVTFTVTNSGPNAITNGVLRITLPATTTRSRANGGTLVTSNFTGADSALVTVTINSLASGASGTFVLQVRNSLTGRAKVTAQISAATSNDFVPTNNFRAAFYTV